jgi:hypothetical protein
MNRKRGLGPKAMHISASNYCSTYWLNPYKRTCVLVRQVHILISVQVYAPPLLSALAIFPHTHKRRRIKNLNILLIYAFSEAGSVLRSKDYIDQLLLVGPFT